MKKNSPKNMLNYFRLLVRNSYIFLGILVSFSIIFVSINYLTPNFNKGYLIGKEEIFYFYKYILYVHIVAAPIVYFSGAFQFVFKKSKYHQQIGKIYIFTVLVSFFQDYAIKKETDFGVTAIIFGGRK